MTELNKKINELANVNLKIASLMKNLEGHRSESIFIVAKLQTALEFKQQLLSGLGALNRDE